MFNRLYEELLQNRSKNETCSNCKWFFTDDEGNDRCMRFYRTVGKVNHYRVLNNKNYAHWCPGFNKRRNKYEDSV